MRARLLRQRPPTRYPAELPVARHRETIARAVAAHPVVVVSAETGSGKTTQIPKICLDLGRGERGLIGCTQPRRIAALTVAARVAEELGNVPGRLVGHQIRFDARLGPGTCIKFMTDGILLAETAHDPDLLAYDTLLIDEAHERSLNIDFLLGYTKQLLARRRDLKLIVSSATLDVDRFSRFFDDAPVVEIEGTAHPTEVRYRDQDEDSDIASAVAEAIDEITAADARGDVLVFLSGERDIRETADTLRGRDYARTEVIPLMARLTTGEQRRAFHVTGQRRIVVATNVAETSVTIPGIRYVVDSGQARVSRYHHRTQVQRLHIEPVSRASAEQRRGRCGRVGPGTCVRLYSEEDYASRPEFTDPEIKRTSLGSVILRMLELGLGDIKAFPFIEPPTPAMIRDGFRELTELGAIDDKRALTALGRQLAGLPLEPRLGRVILAAREQEALREILVIVAGLSIDEPRQRPLDRRDEADEVHARFRNQDSDFATLLNMWRFIRDAERNLPSKSRFRRFCHEHFLSYRRVREWRDVHDQIAERVAALGFELNKTPAAYDAIHRALLTGLLSRVATLREGGLYQGARGLKVTIFPGSGLAGRSPKWIVAGELVETSRLFARCVAAVRPEWIEQTAGDLCRRAYHGPYWDEETGHARALETVTLYGLTLVSGRRRDYGPIDPAASREIMIRHGLVPGRMPARPPFLRHNTTLYDSVRTLQHKARRVDLLADEQQMFEFYDERLPADVCSANSLRTWLAGPDTARSRLLRMDRAFLLRGDADHVDAERFPDAVTLGEETLPLTYLYQRGDACDGVTCTVPLRLADFAATWHADWLVPGLLPEKLAFLMRALPKTLRRELVPVPRTVDDCMAVLRPYEGPLDEALSRALRRVRDVNIPLRAWQDIEPPEHLRMNFRIIDNHGKTLGVGRDLATLVAGLERDVRARAGPGARSRWERRGITAWDFGQLPEQVEMGRAGLGIAAYAALVDDGDAAAIRLFASPAEAARAHRRGTVRLLAIQLARPARGVRRDVGFSSDAELGYALMGGDTEGLVRDMVDLAIDTAFLALQPPIRDAAAFAARIENGLAALHPAARELTGIVEDVLCRTRGLLSAIDAPAAAPAAGDLRSQLGRLVWPGFLASLDAARLRHYPRYLEAARVRIERLRNDPARDERKAAPLRPYWEACLAALQEPCDAETLAELTELRWMIEEWRVNVFAQELRTPGPVSEKRVRSLWERIRGSRA